MSMEQYVTSPAAALRPRRRRVPFIATHPSSSSSSFLPFTCRFVSNNRGIDRGKDPPRQLLEDLYRSIKANQIKMSDGNAVESDVVTFMAPVMQGWLSKQGTGTFAGWKKHWFVLADTCLYYFARQGATGAQEQNFNIWAKQFHYRRLKEEEIGLAITHYRIWIDAYRR